MHQDPRLINPVLGPNLFRSDVKTQGFCVRRPDPKLIGPAMQLNPRLLGLILKRGLKLLNLVLQPYLFKLGLGKFNIIICIINIIIFIIIIIINIQNIIICIIIIIIFITINIINIINIIICIIINIIINKFEKHIINIEKQPYI